ncbi:MAG: TrkH family potassium uptake protein [Spirochaetia bacterium]|nr:TrkH family potassium uptake protein [Spirochaetia bacterium]
MNLSFIFHLQGRLLFFIPLAVIPSLCLSIGQKDGSTRAFLITAAISLIAGLVIFFTTKSRPRSPLKANEGYLAVALSWVIMSLVGAVPFLLLKTHSLSFTDAVFESVSGFTTTGASIIPDVEIYSNAVMFWRAMSHWIGGMGIILLAIAILPRIGVGGMQLFSAEVTGPTKEKLTPRIAETARILFGVYILLTVVEILLLKYFGMNLFDSVFHSFSSISTGGFSNKNISVAAYDSPAIHLTIIFFMFLGGMNFSLLSFALRGQWQTLTRNREFHFYIFIIVVVSLLIFWNVRHLILDPVDRLRHAFFSVISLMTTTGFASVDFDKWPDFSRLLLLAVMFIGGCGGSTSGGIKTVRVYVLLKYTFQQIRKTLHPNEIGVTKIGDRIIPEPLIQAMMGFILIYGLIYGVSVLTISCLGYDVLTALSSVAATLNNVGPGFNLVGPMSNYSSLVPLAKWVYIFCMLAGRLEIVALILLFYPGTWTRW